MMKAKELTNVDVILLTLAAAGGFMRRRDIIDTVNAWRALNGYIGPLAAIYFTRHKAQSPFYTFDKQQSTYTKEKRPYGGGHCAKCSVWKLTPRGVLRVQGLGAQILVDSVFATS